MRNLIIQYYIRGDGKKYKYTKVPEWGLVSRRSFEDYAKKFNVEYMWYEQQTVNAPSPFFESLRPVYDNTLDVYDYILYVDCDVYATKNIDNIFDYANNIGDVGGVMDRHITELDEDLVKYISRKNQTFSNGWFNYEVEAHDAIRRHYHNWFQWKKSTTHPDLDQFINSGVIMWSKKGRLKARKQFKSMLEYYTRIPFGPTNGHQFQKYDQGYLNAMLIMHDFDVTELPLRFNDQRWEKYQPPIEKSKFIHFTGDKGKDKLVHIY
jgi:lipopolysaccharide biosynthesis glycosyltransferase